MRRSRLREASVPASQEETPKTAGACQPLTAPTPRRVLVVEDTPANQQVMRAILNQRGHLVQIANNGRDGIDMLLRDEFDVVLMDVQMPTMDGLQATQAIRKLTAAEKARVPIIALTTHVRHEDRVKCFAVGMNAYLGKPIDAAEVICMVEAMSPGHRSSDASNDNRLSAPAGLIDLATARRRMGGDEELLKDMARFFLADSPQMLEEIRGSFAQGDAANVQRVAHGLKGLASNFNASLVIAAVQRLEDDSRDGRVAEATVALDELIRETHRVQDELRTALALD